MVAVTSPSPALCAVLPLGWLLNISSIEQPCWDSSFFADFIVWLYRFPAQSKDKEKDKEKDRRIEVQKQPSNPHCKRVLKNDPPPIPPY
jgi:hypothetical protein